MKKQIIIILILLLTAAALFVGFRYGWRLFGFRFCSSEAKLDSLSVSGEAAVLSLHDTEACRYSGAIMKQEGSRLLVGLHIRAVLSGKTEDFRSTVLRIPLRKPIDQIVLCGGDGERVVWDRCDSHVLAIRAGIPSSASMSEQLLCTLLQDGKTIQEQRVCAGYGTSEFLFPCSTFPETVNFCRLCVRFTLVSGKEVLAVSESVSLTPDTTETGYAAAFALTEADGVLSAVPLRKSKSSQCQIPAAPAADKS